MNIKYEKRLVELVEALFENSRYLLKSSTLEDVNVATDISHLKGYIEVLKDNFPIE